MLSDIQIAQQAVLKPITKIAQELGIEEEELEPYGRYKAKVNDKLFQRVKDRKDGRLVLVTAINPTPAGEGKTTVTTGLGQAMAKIGKKAVIALREPSLGPVFGVKGRRRGRRLFSGAPDGGYQPALYRRYARHYRREQSSVCFAGQSHPPGKFLEYRPQKDPD